MSTLDGKETVKENPMDELANIATLLLNQKTNPIIKADDNEFQNGMTFRNISQFDRLNNEEILITRLKHIAQDFLSQSQFQAADVWIQKSR